MNTNGSKTPWQNDFQLTFQLHIAKTALLTTYRLNGFQLCLWLQGAKNFHIHLSLQRAWRTIICILKTVLSNYEIAQGHPETATSTNMVNPRYCNYLQFSSTAIHFFYWIPFWSCNNPGKNSTLATNFFIGSLRFVLVKVTKYHIFQDFTAKLRFANLRCLEKNPKWWFSMGSNQ